MIHDSFTGISAAGVKHYDINSGSTYAQIVDAVAELVKGWESFGKKLDTVTETS